MAHYYRLQLQYQGTNYHGWQIQEECSTIQGTLNQALKILAKSDNIHTLGAGRTDAGVHALGQVVRVQIPIFIPPLALQRGLNSLLPPAIQVTQVQMAEAKFHPIKDASSKEYLYLFITDDQLLPPFWSPLVALAPRRLDFDKMQELAPLFLGEHDFVNFQTVGTQLLHTRRSIMQMEIIPHCPVALLPGLPLGVSAIRVVGNGFLKNMVRLITGALWKIGQGRVSRDQLLQALQGGRPMPEKLGPVAPPQGLYLVQVVY